MPADKHNSDSTVRDFLLELVDATSMVSFEHRYFTEPEFLKAVELEEDRMIEDYLLGRLDGRSRTRFEEICEHNTLLASKLIEIRQRLRIEHAKPVQKKRSFTYFSLPVVGLACVALLLYVAIPRPSSKIQEAKLDVPKAAPFIDVRLSPGISKGVGKGNAGVVVSSKENRFRFTFEMPGMTGPISCKVRINRILDNGSRRSVAETVFLKSRPGPNTEAVFVFEAISLDRGDYLADLLNESGAVIERYAFQSR